jgi:RNA-directed DNA polymerase
MLLTLRGLEKAAKQAAPKWPDKVNTIEYADDFIITGASKEILEDKVKPAVKAFLKERGLELSEEKTKITHIDDGFDFLGFNIRKYKDKLLTKPAKSNVLKFVKKIKEIIEKNKTTASGDLIAILNPKIRGWGNYYRHAVSAKTFSYVDYKIYNALFKWAKRRHHNKNLTWIVRKYYNMGKGLEWKFHGWCKLKGGDRKYQQLVHLQEVPIRRHIKVKMDANPYDPCYADYFKKRRENKGHNTLSKLLITAL